MSDYDSPWKDVLELYFADFLALLFPQAHAGIDWSRGWESLDQELQQVVRDAELGKRLADKLMKVWRKDGREQMIIVHTEVQNRPEAAFQERMFVYHYRIYDRHRCPVVSLAVLTDSGTTWRPDRFGYELWGCRLELRFPVVKLQDYNERWTELEASDNPFAVVVMAHLQSQITRADPQQRLNSKMALVRRLYQRGFVKQDVLELFRFIDWVMTLPETLEARFGDQLAELEAECQMRYITSIERAGIEKGKEQGTRHGAADTLHRLLVRRFGPLPDWAQQRLAEADTDQINAWADRLLDAPTLEDVLGPPLQ